MAPRYQTVHSIKIGGALLPPGADIDVSGDEADRLLQLGAIQEKLVPAATAQPKEAASPPATSRQGGAPADAGGANNKPGAATSGARAPKGSAKGSAKGTRGK